ncbi:MAG TPA: hypothetical protein VK534_02705, partial [Methylomirabilota bacterium]|nr:hypothetical protein [Methylomirabilota bacterium]
EITGIIDKVHASNGKVVALVLPKRAAVFQSIVNMKLLKRAADADKKNLALITTEAGLLPLAGAAGIHVAKTLTSKPEIPSAPGLPDDSEDAVQEDGEEVPPDPNAPVGQLAMAGAAGAAASKVGDDGVETVSLADEELPPGFDKGTPGPKSFEPPKGKGKGAGKKNKKLSVPNFERFRLWLILGGVLLAFILIGFLYLTFATPKATISIKTDATSVDVNQQVNLSTTATEPNIEEATLPAKLASLPKTLTASVATTGQKNNGNKASGTISLTNCSDQDGDINIPVGSSFSSGGNTYITQEAATVSESTFNNSHKCTSHTSTNVTIIAQSAGSAFNGATGFSAGSPYSGVTGTGSTSGGTDNIVHSVNQNDITNAKNKMAAANETDIKKTLNDQLSKDKLYGIEATYSAGTPAVTTSANVGTVADNVTVTQAITYTMFGVKKDQLRDLVEDNIKNQIDAEKQTVLDAGIDTATYNVDILTGTSAQLTMTTKAIAGPALDVATIKTNSAGKKAGAIKADLANNPDVTSVTVKVSPFWISNVPKKTDSIKVEIAKPPSSAKASSSNDSND